MKKMRPYLIGLTAAMALAGCSNDDLVNGSTTGPALDGDAYVTLNIVDADSRMYSPAMRETTDAGYVNGEQNENIVKTARFFFYDNSGNFLCEGKSLSNPTMDYTQEDGDNISAKTPVTLVLDKDELSKSTPTQVVAVINAPTTLLAADAKPSLSELQKMTADTVLATVNKAEVMIMCNSVYVDATGATKFATPVTTANIQSSEAASAENPVEIYVERLAAKVELKNEVDNITVEKVQYYENGAYKTGPLTVTLGNWGLNAQNKSEYLAKNVTDLTYGSPWEGWSSATAMRCHWAIDPNYSYVQDYYPVIYGHGESNTLMGIGTNAALQYSNWSQLTTKNNNTVYCLENTISGLSLNQHMGATTHILLQGTMKIGDDTKTWIRFKGVYFGEEDYVTVAVSELNERNDFYTSTDENKARTTANDWQIKNAYDGFVTVELKDNVTLYDAEGNEISADDITAAVSKLSSAYGYKDGKLYYFIPIESETQTNDIQYGIVRNHWHELTVKSIQGVGTPVWDENEPIVPHPEEESYFVSARLNVLSWHKIKQEVTIGQ